MTLPFHKSLFFFFAILTALVSAQERMLLRIGEHGIQEAIPLAKGESAKSVIERREGRSARFIQANSASGLIDTIRYYPYEAVLTTNFGWTHQDVALQWYEPQAPGVVKEFWWYNYQKQGIIKKATIRAWNIDPRLKVLPSIPPTKYLGTYKDPTDGDGTVQPFKPSIGDQWFYSNGSADSSTYSFDPMLSEADWLDGGLQVSLDSNTWQGIKLEDWGDTMTFKLGAPFGFTISNDTKLSDIDGGTDERMEILSWANSAGAPYHSLKFYEQGRTGANNKGWHLRGDYEWGMYVVVEYSSIPLIRIIFPALETTLSPKSRLVCVSVSDDNPGGPGADLSVFLYYRSNLMEKFDSVQLIKDGYSFCGYIPSVGSADMVYYYIRVIEGNGNMLVSQIRMYKIFKKKSNRLFIYNNAQYNPTIAKFIYTDPADNNDFWSPMSDGTKEIGNVMALYANILVADGSFPARNIFNAMKDRLLYSTIDGPPVSLFYTSQDYGCFIQSSCLDTTFSSGSMEFDFFGISGIGPQDLPPTNKPFRIIPKADTVTNYLLTYGADSGASLWYNPAYELGFSGYQDAMTPRAEAKALFKDAGTNVMGVKFITPSTRTAFLAFDAGALQFRGDTSLNVMSDPKYKWIADVGALSSSFFKAHGIVSSVEQQSGLFPQAYSLQQNYPNPFNPSTVIEYSVPMRSHVEIVIVNILGQTVATIVDGVTDAGTHRIQWDAAGFSTGLYFCQMRSPSQIQTIKMLLLK